MNPKIKKLIDELSEKLIKSSYIFMLEKMDDEEETSDLIDFIVSTHLSSMFELMKKLTDGNNEIEMKVHEFITEVTNCIKNLSMIEKIEVINQTN